MKDVLFYQNYDLAGDISAIAVCIICWLLLGSTYTIKQKNLVIFHLANALVFLASISSITYHALIERISVNNVPFIYFFRNVSYIALIFTYVLYIIYISNLVDLQGKAKQIVAIGNWVALAVFIVCEISSPISKLGFHIDENQQIHENYYLDVFRFFYMYYLIFICCLMHRKKKNFIPRMYQCIRNVMIVSFGLMTALSLMESTSVVCITFTFPILAALFLFHYNAYDSESGTLDRKAFDSYIKEMKDKKFTMIVLSLVDINAERMHELAVEFCHFNEKYFKSMCTFVLSDNTMAIIYEDEKNKNARQSITQMLEDFNVNYERLKIDYRIIFIDSDMSLLSGKDYLELNEFLQGKMSANTVYHCEKKDLSEFWKVSYIANQVADIGLKKDMSDERVLVYCQPIVNAQDGTVSMAEALLRLKLPNIGIVFPDQIVSLAEKQRCLHSLNIIMLDKCCKEIKNLESKGYNIEHVSVKFSLKELRDKNFVNDIKELIQKNGIAYSKIAVELKESVNEVDYEAMKQVMKELHSLGIKIYLVDYCYANIQQTLKLPFDIIKMERTLPALSGKKSEYKSLIASFVDIFRHAGHEVLFEGIASEEEETRCKQMQASYLQGFHISRPIPMERLGEYLARK